MIRIAAVASLAIILAHPLFAAQIERACLKSDRGGDRALCGCIQDAANLTLTPRDQRRAAGFFEDPHQAQVVRQSDRRSDEAFWKRYKNFGQTAEVFCQS